MEFIGDILECFYFKNIHPRMAVTRMRQGGMSSYIPQKEIIENNSSLTDVDKRNSWTEVYLPQEKLAVKSECFIHRCSSSSDEPFM